MNESKKLNKARRRLIALRDNAFFDKLKQAYGIVPKDKKNRSNLKKLADVLELAENDEVKKTRGTYHEHIKQANYDPNHDTSNEESFIHELASMLANDATLRESAELLFDFESKNESDS